MSTTCAKRRGDLAYSSGQPCAQRRLHVAQSTRRCVAADAWCSAIVRHSRAAAHTASARIVVQSSAPRSSTSAAPNVQVARDTANVLLWPARKLCALRAHAMGRRRTRRRPEFVSKVLFSDLKFKTLDTIWHNRMIRSGKTLALIPLLWIRIDPPARQRMKKQKGRETINTKNRIRNSSFIGHCDSLRQSGPRPDPRLLRQAALEALTRSARTDSPRRTGQKQISDEDRRRVGGGGGGGGGVN
ncbi:hypothetical protein F511_37240 [Dorcoceras hygrometricum]|uniref:Uncharacterized protein n=1 Tax=Dorcoceras hygrometricum TaxID=472368 RepID=A0A2Z7AWK8_9LAMI|nr:hypothetical protein F511_37240 [Dorcoceras hygrometricum]